MRWDRISVLIDRLKDELERYGLVFLINKSKISPVFSHSVSAGISKSTTANHPRAKYKQGLFARIAWTT